MEVIPTYMHVTEMSLYFIIIIYWTVNDNAYDMWILRYRLWDAHVII